MNLTPGTPTDIYQIWGWIQGRGQADHPSASKVGWGHIIIGDSEEDEEKKEEN